MQCGSTYAIGDLFEGLLDLVERGLIEPPQHDSYAIGAAHLALGAWMGTPDGKVPPIDIVRPLVSRIEHAIWRQFEVEGGGEISLANFDKYMSGKIDGKWSSILVTLSDEGLLDRQRLADGQSRSAQSRFQAVSRRLVLSVPRTVEARRSTSGQTQRSACTWTCLASPIGPTVSMAVAALLKVQKAGKLDSASAH